jgi:hypothetical protein
MNPQPMYPGGSVRQIGLSYWPARLHRLAESIAGLLKSLQIRALGGGIRMHKSLMTAPHNRIGIIQ